MWFSIHTKITERIKPGKGLIQLLRPATQSFQFIILMMNLKKILVLDDDLDILVVVQLLFKVKGFDVMALSRWEELYEKAESFKPDIILLDVLLSGNDGRDICKVLKKKATTKHIPVILFSANPSVAKNVIESGANGFVHKPFEVKDLLKTIESNINKS